MRMLIAVLLTTALAGCAGAIDASPVPGPAPIPGVKSAELTEPWKSMNLPVEGAIVEDSADDYLLVRFVAASPEDLAPAYAALKQGLVDAGWEARRETAGGGSMSLTLTTSAGKRATLSVLVDADRPLARISVSP